MMCKSRILLGLLIGVALLGATGCDIVEDISATLVPEPPPLDQETAEPIAIKATLVPATVSEPPTPAATEPPPPTPEPEPESTLGIGIPGNTLGWLSSGIWLEAGDSFTMEADGTINIWPNCQDTKADAGYPDLDCTLVTEIEPTGTTVFDPAKEDYPYPGGPTAALVARVGEGDLLLVGMGGTFTADAAGILKFAINDIESMWDNSGEFVVQVTVPYDIDPATIKGSWEETDIFVEAGETFTITVSGTINMWPNCEETKAEQGFPHFDCALASAVGPDGIDVFGPGLAEYPMPGENVLAVIGRIGNGAPFLIGSKGTFVAESGGPLLVATNDTPYWKGDDQGVFVVTIVRDASAAPVDTLVY